MLPQAQKDISRELHCCRRTIRKALRQPEPPGYRLQAPRPRPVLESYQQPIEHPVAANKNLPRKQRYTVRKIFREIQKAGYTGSEGSIRRYVAQLKAEHRSREAFLPLE
jgi:transposase